MNPQTAFPLLLLHASATWYMVGLIWMVQLVHYPLMAHVGTEQFVAYEKQHTFWTTWVVGPPMLLELATLVWLIRYQQPSVPSWSLWSGAALLAIIWISTQFVQVPCHAKLSQAFDAGTHRWLVNSNWIRTAGWSLRGLLALVMLRRIR